MRILFLALVAALLVVGPAVDACTVCRPKVEAGIHTQAYATNVLLLLLPVVMLVAGGVGLFYADTVTRKTPRRR